MIQEEIKNLNRPAFVKEIGAIIQSFFFSEDLRSRIFRDLKFLQRLEKRIKTVVPLYEPNITSVPKIEEDSNKKNLQAGYTCDYGCKNLKF